MSLLPGDGGAAPRPARTSEIRPPDCVCYPVEGSGYLVSARTGIRSPVGALTPLMENDSLVVLSGRITVIDLRTGRRTPHLAPARVRIPAFDPRKPPSLWARVREGLMQALTEPELRRIGGSVRETLPVASPNRVRLANGVRVLFEWSDLAAAVRTIRVEGPDTNTTTLPLAAGGARSGGYAWDPAADHAPGLFAWSLLDDDGIVVASGSFEIMTPAQSEAERVRYRQAAAALYGQADLELTSAILAATDRTYLW